MCCVLCLVAQSWTTLLDPTDCSLPGSSVHEDSSSKNTGVGCHALLQEIFPTQGSNPGLPHCRQIFTIWAARPAHCLNRSHFVYLCVRWWTFGLFPLFFFLATFNNAAMNISVQILRWTYVSKSLGYITRSRTARSYGLSWWLRQ